MAKGKDKPDRNPWGGPEADRFRRRLRHPTQPWPEDLADILEPYRGKPIPDDLFDHLLATLRGTVERPSGQLARDPDERRDRQLALRFAMEDYPHFLARARRCKAYLRKSGKLRGRSNSIWQEEPSRIAAHFLVQSWGRALAGLSPRAFLNELAKLRRR